MTRSKSKKNILAVMLAVIVFGAVIFLAAFRQFGDSGKSALATYQVKSETYTSTIEIAGTISAAKEQDLQAAGDGTVKAVYVKEGETVTRGQIILQMDDSEQRYNLAKHDFEIEQKQINGSPRELQLMTAQREVLLQRIKDRQIVANFDGVIAEFSAAAGDVLEAKDVVGVIVDRTYLAATVEVVETDAPKLRIGQKVTLTFPANGKDTVEGRVYSFPTVATKSSRGASVVEAEIRVDNPPDIILPGYSFTGEIEIKPPETLLLVERQAIGYEGSLAFAERILDETVTERIIVQAEPYGEDFIQIFDGLSEGDILIAQEKMRPSGWNRTAAQSGNERNSEERTSDNAVMPMMPGMPPMGGGGPGGPPPP